jgi:hypothetical protein
VGLSCGAPGGAACASALNFCRSGTVNVKPQYAMAAGSRRHACAIDAAGDAQRWLDEAYHWLRRERDSTSSAANLMNPDHYKIVPPPPGRSPRSLLQRDARFVLLDEAPPGYSGTHGIRYWVTRERAAELVRSSSSGGGGGGGGGGEEKDEDEEDDEGGFSAPVPRRTQTPGAPGSGGGGGGGGEGDARRAQTGSRVLFETRMAEMPPGDGRWGEHGLTAQGPFRPPCSNDVCVRHKCSKGHCYAVCGRAGGGLELDKRLGMPPCEH